MKRFLNTLTWWQWIILWISLLSIFSTTGIATGYSSGLQERQKSLAVANAIDLGLQFELGVADLDAGRYDLARQRFEYILGQEPGFPGVIDRLAETLILLSNSAIPEDEVIVPLPTPSPTPDTRTIDELFAVAQGQLHDQNWKGLLQTILALRDIDPLYQVSHVDRMLFLALRNAGIEKIINDGDLEGGLYDLSLAEQFVFLDAQANTYREWAYLYQFGVSFWGLFPDKVVDYFSQLASAAPFLHDFSDIFAKDRYRMALLVYGDHLVELGGWCAAAEQYTLAQSLLDDQGVQLTLVAAEEQCRVMNGIQSTPIPADNQATLTPELTITLEATPTPEGPSATEIPTSAPDTTTPEPTPTLESTPTPETP